MDEPQMRLAEAFGSFFKSRFDGWLEINQAGSARRFEEIVLRRVKYGGDWLTVQVVKSDKRNVTTAKIFFKGNLRILRRFLRTGSNSAVLNDID